MACRLWLLSLYLLIQAPWGQAREALVVPEDLSTLDLNPYLELATQATSEVWQGKLQELPPLDFGSLASQHLEKLGSATAWVRLSLQNPGTSTQDFFIYGAKVLYPLHIYELKAGRLELLGGVSPEMQSTRLDQDLGTLTLPLQLKAGEQREIYFQFQRELPLSNPRLSLLSPQAYRGLLSFENASRYLIIGISLAMFGYNFFMSMKLRQRQYVYYVAYLFCFLLNIIASNLHILSWTDSLFVRHIYPEWVSVSTDLVYLFASLFTLAFLKMEESDRRLRTLVQVFVWCFAIQALVGLVSPRIAGQWRAVTGLIGGPLLFVAGIRAMLRNYAPAKYFVLGWGIAILSNSGWIIAGLGWIPHSFWVDWGVSYGVVAEMFVLSLALSSRFQLEQRQAKAQIEDLNQSLEQKVYEQTIEMRRLLENTHLGLLSVERELKIHRDYSKHLEEILESKHLAGRSIWEVLFSKAQMSEDDRSRARCALEYSIDDHVMFYDANLDVLPKRLLLRLPSQAKTLDLDWSAITRDDGIVERILLGITDVSSQLRAEAEAASSRLRLMCVAEFLEVGSQSFQRLAREIEQLLKEMDTAMRQKLEDFHPYFLQLHTLKSRARMDKYLALTSVLHEVEEDLQVKAGKRRVDLTSLASSLQKLSSTLTQYYEALASMAKFKHEDGLVLPGSLLSLLKEYEPLVQSLARDLGKVDCRLAIDLVPDKILDPSLYQALTTAIVHIFRNIVDHGAETPEEREQKQKHAHLTIRIAWGEAGCLVVQDDGRGLDLKRIADKAQRAGLHLRSLDEQLNVIFQSGISTKDEADQNSGRGVGMEAVRTALRSLGGDAWVEAVGQPSSEGFAAFRLLLKLPNMRMQTIDQVA